jgi:aldehyde dehydrogenase (NAD+)
MSHKSLEELVSRQKRYFEAGSTRSVPVRRSRLDDLRRAVKACEAELFRALAEDLGKGELEAYGSEIGYLYQEIDFASRQLPGWSRPRRVRTELIALPARGSIRRDPYGVSLIMSPWNYPVQLSLVPLVGAIAGGNTAVLKPSELAPACSRALARMIGSAFDPSFVAVVEGDARTASSLLDQPFDKILYAGSPRVGRIVMEKAAARLTPVTLELGGKNPVLEDRTASPAAAARKIVWGKYLGRRPGQRAG